MKAEEKRRMDGGKRKACQDVKMWKSKNKALLMESVACNSSGKMIQVQVTQSIWLFYIITQVRAISKVWVQCMTASLTQAKNWTICSTLHYLAEPWWGVEHSTALSPAQHSPIPMLSAFTSTSRECRKVHLKCPQIMNCHATCSEPGDSVCPTMSPRHWKALVESMNSVLFLKYKGGLLAQIRMWSSGTLS